MERLTATCCPSQHVCLVCWETREYCLPFLARVTPPVWCSWGSVLQSRLVLPDTQEDSDLINWVVLPGIHVECLLNSKTEN